MARIRTIKPEFFTSESVVSVSPFARLLFIAMWCEADRSGRLLWKSRTLRYRYFPADDVDIESLCDELIEQDMIRLYRLDDDLYCEIPKFSSHQVINNRERESELCLVNAQRLYKFDACVTREGRVKAEGKGREGKGKEGKGRKENNIVGTGNSCTAISSSENEQEVVKGDCVSDSPVRVVFDHWVSVMKKKNPVLDDKRRKKIQQALNSHGIEKCILAINGCAKSEWHMGRHKNNSTPYNEITKYILKDAETIEKNMEMFSEKSSLQKTFDQIDAGEI